MQTFGNCLLPYVLLLLTLSANAQPKGYEPGYIITLQRDTVPGWVKDRAPEPFVELYRRIRFRPEGKSSRKKYRPADIIGYRAGNREYVSIPLREESAFFRFRYYIDPQADHTFLRLIRREGTLSWYEQEFVYDDNHYLDSFPLFHRQGSREMVRVTQGILGLKKKRLSEYFQDCRGLVNALSEDKVSTVNEVYQFYLKSCESGDAHVLSRGIYRIVQTDSGRLQTPERVPLIKRMEELRIPGLGVAVIEDYELREILFYGQTGRKTRIDRQTLFQAASVSKLLTALLVHHFVYQGMLDLDTDINEYLSSWNLPENAFSKQRPITLRQLLSHQSGLPATNLDYMLEQGVPTLGQILDGSPPALNKPAIPREVPGKTWVYSNIGYVLVQKILEDRLGTSFEDLASEVLFEPAAMDLSTFEYPLPTSLADNEALPHDKNGHPQPPELESPAKAQGGLMTTPEELANLLAEVMKASKWESEVFPRAMADGLLHTETALPFKWYGQRASMGLGALIIGEGKQVAFVHNGYNSPGAVCIAIGFPYLGKGAVIMANGARGETLYLEILATLAECYQWPTGQFFKPKAGN